MLLLTLAVVAGTAAFFLVKRSNPAVRHQGRDAWEWAARLESPTQQARDEATAALHAMGTNAIPLLRRRLLEQEPLWNQARLWIGERLPGKMGSAFTRDLKLTAASVRSIAANGLKALGTNAAPAAPELMRALHDSDRQVVWRAAVALGQTGEAGVLGLIALLDDSNPDIRHAATYALGEIGPPALAAVPALVKRVGEKNESLRSSALHTLSRIGPIAGPAILRMIQEDRGETRRSAARALVAVHPRGQLTLPVLVEMAHDPEATSRAAAIEALTGLHITHGDAMTVYVGGLNDTNPAVRLAAAKALGQAAPKAGHAVMSLEGLRETDPDEAVRIAAGVALDRIAALKSPRTNGP